MDRILVIGSYVVGLTVTGSKHPRAGETILGDTFDMGHGGKGSNQAVAIARLGGQVDFVAKVGNDVFGQRALGLFKAEDIGLRYISVDDTTHTGAGIIFLNAEGKPACEDSIVFASRVAAYAVTSLGVVPGLPALSQVDERRRRHGA